MFGYGGFGGMGAGMGLFGGVMMLLFWVALILLVGSLVRSVFPSQRQTVHESADEILKRRYAAGEISRAEYEQARATLAQSERANQDVMTGGRQ